MDSQTPQPVLTPAERQALSSMADILRNRNQGYGQKRRGTARGA